MAGLLKHVTRCTFAVGGGLTIYSHLKKTSPDMKYTRWVPTVLAKSGREDITTGAGVATAKGLAQETACRPIPGMCNPCCPAAQCNIITGPKIHSLYLWVKLTKEASPSAVAKVAADIDSLIESVTGPCDDPCCDEVVAGVGFGPNFYCQVNGKTCKNFNYAYRKAPKGAMPATEGDIFLHAKSNNKGKLFEVAKNYICSFPAESVAEFEDIYGYDYRCSRDLSGFLINQSNRCDQAGMRDVAIECGSGGSYALAMKWVHDAEVVASNVENKVPLENIMGRDMHTNEELKNKKITCHTARMTGTTEPNPQPLCEVVSQCQPFGSLQSGFGQFYLAYAADPCAHEFLLDQMTGAGIDSHCDDLFQMSTNTKGSYFYFPSVPELSKMMHP